MPFDRAEANRLVNAMLGKGTYPAPTGAIMARLLTAHGTETTPGTQVTNTGESAYAPQSVTAATPASATNGVMTSNAAITFTNMPAATVVGIELWDSGATPRRQMYGALTATKTTALGDSLTIASGQLTATVT